MPESESDEYGGETTHTVEGNIGGRDVELVVTGPEAQDLSDDEDGLGSDVVVDGIQRKLGELQNELEAEA